MKLIALISLLLAYGHCQFIFPDEYESTYPSINYGRTSERRLPFPTLSIPNVAAISQNFPTYSYGNRDYMAAAAPSGSFASSTIPKSNTIFNQQKYWTDYANNILASGVSRFALNINHAIAGDQRATSNEPDRNNIVFSPVNLAGTLAMILVGAAGRTFNETVNILGFNLGIDVAKHSEIVHQMFGVLLKSVELGSKTRTRKQLTTNGPEIFVAGGIFVQEGYSIRPEFQAIVENIYKSDVITVNFQSQPKTAQNIINNWVDTNTRGKIHNILGEAPDVNTKVILASALFFNCEWHQHFIKSATKRKPFFLASGRTIDVDMMYNGGEFPFYKDNQLGVKILGLPYKNSDMNLNANDAFHFETTMYVLLPISSDANAIDDLQSRLSVDIIDRLIGQMRRETCIIGIPRMKLSSTVNLNHALQSLGLTSLFNPSVANLGLLASGLNATSFTSTNDDPVIFPRFNDVDESTTNTPNSDFSGRKNYFRYEDTNGGFLVEQWDNGVYLEKIRRVYRTKRRAAGGSEGNNHYTPKYGTIDEGDDSDRVKVIGLDENKYRFEKRKRNKRQVDDVDGDFVRFIQSQRYQTYGLDTLRNSGNFINPGLYASDVLHKVEMDITEMGTVAAAATGVIIQRNGNQKRLIANRPFLFFIRHESTKLILFWGTVNKPTPNYS